VEDATVDMDWLRKHVTDPNLVAGRMTAAVEAAEHLNTAGRRLQLAGQVIGDGRLAEASSPSSAGDEQVAMGVLAQIAADLLATSSSLLAGEHPYSGAALLRQVVEVEYLTWAIAQGKRDAARWLNSTRQERREFFTPAGLRRLSDGRFDTNDYQHHCEQGGHPVPTAIPLLGNDTTAPAQMLLFDLLLHGWRTTDSLVEWAVQKAPPKDPVQVPLRAGQHRFASWGASDPLYEWSLTAPAAPPPGP
jgi:hypothetical protein